MNELVVQSEISDRIYTMRNEQIIIDRDLAKLYGVETKRLNEQVKRNRERFPADFMFQLNDKEKKVPSKKVWVTSHLNFFKPMINQGEIQLSG